MRRSLRAKSAWTGELRTALSTGRRRADTALPLSSSPVDWQRVAGGWAVPGASGQDQYRRLQSQRLAETTPRSDSTHRHAPSRRERTPTSARAGGLLPSLLHGPDARVPTTAPAEAACAGAGDVSSRGRGHHARGGQSEKCALSAWERQEAFYLFFNPRWIMDGDCLTRARGGRYRDRDRKCRPYRQ
jgi:hypothetical protein